MDHLIQKFDFGGEPINPIQAAIGELLKNAGKQHGSFKELVRDDDGKFSKKD